MHRRSFLAIAPLIGVSGCAGSGTTGNATQSSSQTSSSSTHTESPTPKEISAGQVDDFESLSHWSEISGSLHVDTNEAYQGSQSARLHISEPEGYVRISREFTPPIDVSGLHITAAVMASSNTRPWMRLIDETGDSIVMKTSVRAAMPFQKANFGIHRIDGDPDLSTITELRIADWNGADESLTVWVDDLAFGERQDTGKVHISFDDTNATDYTRAFPILQDHGFSATTFINPSSVGTTGALSVEQLSALDDAGWDISNHTYDHPHLSTLSRSRQKAQILDAKQWLIEHGFEHGAEYFAYPFGDFDRTTLELVNRYHTLGFGGGYLPFGPVTNTALVPRSSGSPDVKTARQAIDLAAEYNGVTALFYHKLNDEVTKKFEETISYVSTVESAGDIEVVTADGLPRS